MPAIASIFPAGLSYHLAPNATRRPWLLLAACGVVLFLSTSGRAAVRTWANVGTDFATPANWGGTAPIDDLTSDLGAFNSVLTFQPVLSANRSINGLQFNNGATGAVTLSGTGTLSIGNKGIANTSTTGLKTIGVNIVLGANQNFSNAGALAIDGNVNVGAFTLGLNGTGSSGTVTGVISGTGGIAKSGTGTWTLSGNNTFSGGVAITGGILNLQNSNALGTSGNLIAVANNTTLQLQNGITIAGESLTLGGAGAVGNGALENVSGTNSWTGGVALTRDTTIQSDAGLLTVSGNVTGTNRTLTVGGAGDTTLSGVVGIGSGDLIKADAGTLTLTGANTYTGATAIQGGTVSINTLANVSGGASSLGAPTTAANGTIAIGSGATGATLQYTGSGSTTNRVINLAGTTGGATLDASGTGALTFTSAFTASGAGSKTLTLTGSSTAANTISGAIVNNSALNTTSLVKDGAGTWVLSGVNTFTGTTTLNDGILRISADNRLGTAPGSATANKLVFNGGTLETTANMTLSSNRGVTVNAGGGTFDVNTGTTLTYNGILAGTGTLNKNDAGTLVLGGTAANTHTGDVNVNGGTLQLASSGANRIIGDNAHVTVASGATLAFKNGSDETIGSLAGSGTVDNIVGPGGAAILTSGGNNASTLFSGVIQNTVSSVSLVKTGTGTLTLSGNNSYVGSTTVNAGALNIQSNNALGGTGVGAGTTVASGAALQLQGGITIAGESLTLAGSGVASDGALRNISGNNTWAGTVTLTGGNPFLQSDSGLLTVSGTLTGSNQSITVGGAGDTLLSGLNNTGSGTLTKNGTGTLTLSGTASRSTDGGTLVNDGTLALNMSPGVNALGLGGPANATIIGDNIGTANSATLTLLASDQISDSTPVTINSDGRFSLNAFSETIGTVTGSGQIDLGSIGSLTVGSGNGSSLFGGTIVNSGSLTKTGSGTFTLTGNSTYTGATNINTGIVNIQSNTALGAPGAGTTVATSAELQLQGGITVTGENLTINGTGTSSDGALHNVSGNNTWTGNITVNSNSSIENDAGLLTLQGNITDAGGSRTLDVITTGNTVISGVIGGTTELDKDGTGVLTLTGTNTFTGDTLVRQGAINIQNGSALGSTSSQTVVSNLAALQLQNNITVTGESLTLTGDGASNTGALRNISGNNTWTGDITINADSTIGSDAGLLTIQGNIINNGFNRSLTVTGAGNTLISGGINTDTGELFKEGTGTLTLTGNSTFTGSTLVDAGVLNIETNAALGSILAGTTVTSGAALQLQSATGITVAGHLTLNGSGIANDGALRNISGNNTWDGPVTLVGNNTLIQSDSGLLTISGDLTGNNQSVTVGGAGDTLLSGTNNTGSGTLTKNGTGTLTLTGSTSRSTDGGTLVNNGTLALNMTSGVNALGTGTAVNATIIGDNIGAASSATLSILSSNQISDSTPVTINSDGRLLLNNFSEAIDSLNGTGLVDLGSTGVLTVGANNGSSLFGGSFAGTGELVKVGIGTLAFNSTITLPGTITISGGTVNLSGFDLTVGTLHITGNSILDFGNSAASILTATNLIVDAGVLLTVNNWVNAVDFFRVQNDPGSAALGRILFTGGSYTVNDTRWQSYDHEVTPAPEPATYGAILAGCSTLLLAWRRRRRAVA